MVTRSSTAMTIRRLPAWGRTALSTALRLSSREALDNAIAGKHSTIDGKVAANHEGSHGCILLSQNVRFVGKIGLVLSTIHEYKACESGRVSIAFIRGVCPSSSSAKT